MSGKHREETLIPFTPDHQVKCTFKLNLCTFHISVTVAISQEQIDAASLCFVFDELSIDPEN